MIIILVYGMFTLQLLCVNYEKKKSQSYITFSATETLCFPAEKSWNMCQTAYIFFPM